MKLARFIAAASSGLLSVPAFSQVPIQISGVYPHLAVYNNENECGIGAIVPWADRLWFLTYSPHKPSGSQSDKLYELTKGLKLSIRPESIGGTPANRMIHKESNQLFIGPYAIDRNRKVRRIPYSKMFGRPTGNARSLTDPAGKILYATMEEGIYEVDVKTLEVKELWGDEANKRSTKKSDLPGYHGKGFYSGQGVYIYSNNGERGKDAQTRPDVPSGVLAEWDGKADQWTIVRRNQFTEVTSPGGILGSANPDTDPIWSVGWDHRSLILAVRMTGNGWSYYRLPKGSHSYDGAHGWNTEWPRIREVGDEKFLMTMHGTFWDFPETFTPASSSGIKPRSNYLKVIGDFTRWGDHIVFGCDDTAKAEFLNTRKAKGHVAPPQSHSNLWFVEPSTLDSFGPLIGRGAVWVSEDVAANTLSDPYFFSGYDHRVLHLHHKGGKAITVALEVDRHGNGRWEKLRNLEVDANGYLFTAFSENETGAWIRLKSKDALTGITAAFSYHDLDRRANEPAELAGGLARPGASFTGGIIRSRDENHRTLSYAAVAADGTSLGYYELDEKLQLKLTDSPEGLKLAVEQAAIPETSLSLEVDEASVIYTDDDGDRWRLPKGDDALGKTHPLGNYRLAREVSTERDLFHAHGTFYELPARNAGGFIKVRPVATHNFLVHDFCSYRGLLVLSGLSTELPDDNPHVIKSDDGKTALWTGISEDLWKFGKPRGQGGPWKGSEVKAGVASDPYLMTAYDRKSLTLESDKAATITAEIDLTGEGNWAAYNVFTLKAGDVTEHQFPDGFQAYWIRFTSDKDTTASAQLSYK